jgi:AraC family transcriptional regulator of adaptative response / DNA-3-methyladenine glycosylase II
MLLDSNACYRAVRARDRRFDGRFFVAVSSTKIYCRPICPARPPKRENMRFYSSAAAAEGAGYRPCLRCHPERAPGLSSVDATSRLVGAAIAGIEEYALSSAGVAYFPQMSGGISGQFPSRGKARRTRGHLGALSSIKCRV